MMAEVNQTEATAAPVAGEEAVKPEVETVAVPKKDYEALNQTLGSLKRELKDLKKAKEDTGETPIKETKTGEIGLLQKGYLRMAGITAEDEVELALSTAKRWGVEVDALIDDEDFKSKLKKLRDTKSNATATSNIPKGGASSSQAKDSVDYWKAKGTPPTPSDVPDRKTRQKIIRELLSTAGNKGTSFYNE